ncbi:MAG: hypothetical protein Fur0032_15170 [Terrimicrobiaceae bacterium]
MLTVTDSAAKGLLALLEEKGIDPAGNGLRLAVEKGGCAGMQYTMTLGSPAENDHVIVCGGARVFVDARSAEYYDECTLDFSDDLTGAGFRVINPKAARSCGCGTSFEPAG